jgi:hypothetical protein
MFERKKAIAVTGAVLVLWFSLNLIIILLEVFGPSTPDLYVYLAILIPVALLAASYVGVAGFRRFLLSIDLRLLIIVQGWRVVGAAFFFLYAFNVLPRVWAFPAAFGDIAIGVTAPVFAMALIIGKSFPRRAFVVWNLLGLLDFVVAAVLGLAVGELVGIRTGEISIAPMTVLPLVLFPTFIVPFFILVHLITLIQVAKRVESSG